MLQRALIFTTISLVVLALFPLKSQSTKSESLLRQLTNTPSSAVNLNPSLSDDGLTVAFESTADLANTGGTAAFHCVRVDVGNVSVAEVAKSRAVTPGLSRDGSSVVFASSEDLVGQNPDRNSEVYLAEGSTLSQITHTKPESIAARLDDGNFQPSLSSDGRFIAFSSNRDLVGLNGDGNTEIFIYDVAAQNYTQITSGVRPARVGSAKIAGDGARVVFVSSSKESDETSDLVLYERSTGSTTLLASGIENLLFAPGRTISNDGARFVYSAGSTSTQSEVMLFDVSARSARQLTSLGTRSTDVNLEPTISGDGKRVAFATRRKVTARSDGSVELYVFDIPTWQIQTITDGPAIATAGVVSSLNFDGSLVAFSFPRVLTDASADSATANNSEIYLAAINPRPAFGVASAVNSAANGNEPAEVKTVAPDSIVNVRGSALALETVEADPSSSDQLPFSLAGTTVSVNGLPARLLFASPFEVVVVLPPLLTEGPGELMITNREGFPAKAPLVIKRGSPGLFTLTGDGRGDGVLLDGDTLSRSPFDPTASHLRLIAFATGIVHADHVSAEINGEPIVIEHVLRSSLQGLDEIHLLIPGSFRGAGLVTLVVTADDSKSNAITLTLAGSPLRDLMINEFLADPPDGLAGDANHDGVRSASADEFVELVNTTTRDIDIGNYELLTRGSNGSLEVVRHRFATGTIISAGTAVVVFGGGNLDPANAVFGGAEVLKASSGGLSLLNSEGLISLRDSMGSRVSSVSYGAGSGLQADNNQSLTRSPDLSGSFVIHTLAAENRSDLFSPGTRVDGRTFVSSPAISSVQVFAPRQELDLGEQMELSARAFDFQGEELDGVIFRWRSSAPSVVAIDTLGVARAVGFGTAQLTATARGATSSALEVVVRQPSPSPSPTPEASPSPTPEPSPSPSPSPSITPLPSPSPTVSPLPSPSPSPSNSPLPSLVISEFRTRGPNGANDEFVEIYNNSDATVNMSGFKLRASNGSGSSTTRLTVNAGTLIPAHSHFLATNSGGYSGTVIGDQNYSSGITNDGGLALTLADDTVIDQVGLSVGSSYKEGMHLAPLPSDANQSYERKPGGLNGSTVDTDDNFNDFALLTPADPQNLSSSPTPSESPTASPTPSPTPTLTPSPTPTPLSPQVVISQVFGGGGNSGAPYRNDFIELFNRGQSPVDLSGWSVQYSGATSSTWAVTNLAPLMLAPGQYYLVQEASAGANGSALPTPDSLGTTGMAATAGKVALVTSRTQLSGTCPIGAVIVDLVGYGPTASCFRGSGPAPAPSNTTAALRRTDGCTDTPGNSSDFLAGQPNPRNSSTSVNPCASLLTAILQRLYEGHWP